MGVAVITPPDPVMDMGVVRQHLRLEDGDTSNSGILEVYLAAAQGMIDGPLGWLGRAIGRQTLETTIDATCGPVALPCPPVVSLVAVSAAGVPIASTSYSLDGDTITVDPAATTDGTAVVRYLAGYEDVPPAIVVAMLLMIGDLFNNRETTIDARASAAGVIPMSTTVENLLNPFRVYG